MIDSDYSFLDKLLEGFFIVDKDLKILFMNEAGCQQAKLTKKELIGKYWTEVVPNIEKTELYRKTKECIATQKPIDMENKYMYPDGTFSWFLLKMQPMDNKVFILSIDISVSKKTETELREQMKCTTALHEISRSIINLKDIHTTKQILQEKILQTLQVDAVGLLLVNRRTNKITYNTGSGFQTELIQNTVVPLNGPLTGKDPGRTDWKQHIVLMHDLKKECWNGMDKELIKKEQFVFAATAPLISRNVLIGILAVFKRSHIETTSTWQDFFNAFAEQTVLTLRHAQLVNDLKEANKELKGAYDKTIEGWSMALELKDRETEGHTLRVAELAVRIGKRAGFTNEEIVAMRRGALLHDIGKLGIPDRILNKHGKLTEAEWAIVKKHPIYARNILINITYLQPSIPIPYCHHEHYDGSGYPQGLKENQIPLVAQLFSVIDVWDALLFDRPYHKAWGEQAIIDYIKSRTGIQFSPYAVDLFLEEYKSMKGQS